MFELINLTKEDIQTAVQIIKKIKAFIDIGSNKKLLYKMPINEVALIYALLPSQTKGDFFENYIREYFEWTEVKKEKRAGDAVTSIGLHYEIKATFPHGKKPKANFVQIRMTTNLAGFVFLVLCDKEESSPHEYLYVPFEKMEDELHEHGSLAHGSKYVDDYERINHPYKGIRIIDPLEEYRVSLTLSSKRYKRWQRDYLASEEWIRTNL